MNLETENESQTLFIKQSLQYLTGITFENTVPLSEPQASGQLAKMQNLRSSLSSSKIIEGTESSNRFIQKILLDNNYDSISPIWEWTSANGSC